MGAFLVLRTFKCIADFLEDIVGKGVLNLQRIITECRVYQEAVVNKASAAVQASLQFHDDAMAKAYDASSELKGLPQMLDKMDQVVTQRGLANMPFDSGAKTLYANFKVPGTDFAFSKYSARAGAPCVTFRRFSNRPALWACVLQKTKRRIVPETLDRAMGIYRSWSRKVFAVARSALEDDIFAKVVLSDGSSKILDTENNPKQKVMLETLAVMIASQALFRPLQKDLESRDARQHRHVLGACRTPYTHTPNIPPHLRISGGFPDGLL